MESSKKKDLLKKLKMPEKASKDPMLSADDSELALDGPASPMDEAMGDDAAPLAGEESPAEEAQELHQLPDDVLMKEMEARGFTVKKGKEGSEEEESSESPDEAQEEGDLPLDSGAKKF